MMFPKHKRIVDKAALRRYAEENPYCEMPGCNKLGHACPHHITYKSQMGDDVPENLITLCQDHHTIAHGPNSREMKVVYLKIKGEL